MRINLNGLKDGSEVKKKNDMYNQVQEVINLSSERIKNGLLEVEAKNGMDSATLMDSSEIHGIRREHNKKSVNPKIHAAEFCDHLSKHFPSSLFYKQTNGVSIIVKRWYGESCSIETSWGKKTSLSGLFNKKT